MRIFFLTGALALIVQAGPVCAAVSCLLFDRLATAADSARQIDVQLQDRAPSVERTAIDAIDQALATLAKVPGLPDNPAQGRYVTGEIRDWIAAERRLVDLVGAGRLAEARHRIATRYHRRHSRVIAAILENTECTPASAAPLDTAPHRRGGTADGEQSASLRANSPLTAIRINENVWKYLILALGSITFSTWRLLSHANKQQRRAIRYNCNLPCSVLTGRAAFAARLVDISQMGGKIATETSMDIGAQVTVLVEYRALNAQIRWSNRHFMGVKFVHPFRTDSLRRLLAAT